MRHWNRNYLTVVYFFWIIFSHVCAAVDKTDVIVFILSQTNKHHDHRSQLFTDHLKKQILENKSQHLLLNILPLHSTFNDAYGGWAVWPILERLQERFQQFYWLLVCEEDSRINLSNLETFLNTLNDSEPYFGGHALFDRHSTIIHHYAFAGKDPSAFKYPDFAACQLINRFTVQRVLDKLSSGANDLQFTIDPKHEFAMLLWNDGKDPSLSFSNVPEFCTTSAQPTCITQYKDLTDSLCKERTGLDDVHFAVKTYHAHYKTRVVVVKRTWAKNVRNIAYYGDLEDSYIPAISLGVNNTERGHCAKTYAIFSHFLKTTDLSWLVVADDDTLLSVHRLLDMLKCYNSGDAIILGERYGYGFSRDGNGGYEYPTGGSGMMFTRAAVKKLVTCECPTPESPDDMIIGMCARRFGIPVLHSASLHQARPEDYAEDYLKRIKPVSFHKHWEVDPYRVYLDYLDVDDNAHKEL